MTWLLLRLAGRTIALGGLWLVLSGGAYWYYGVPVVLAALALSCWVRPPGKARSSHRAHVVSRALAMVHLGVWFAWQSIKGGADVARRAARREVDIEPHYEDLPITLPPGAALDVSMLMISLLPGSLGVKTSDGILCLHVLSPDLAAADQWTTLQRLAARATGVVTEHTPR